MLQLLALEDLIGAALSLDGDSVDKGLIAIRLGPDLPIAVVGAPAYFALHPPPRTPDDLSAHRCVNDRLARGGGFYPWEHRRDGR